MDPMNGEGAIRPYILSIHRLPQMLRKEIERCPVPDAEAIWQSNHQTIFMIQKAGGDASIAEIGRRSISATPRRSPAKSPHAILDRGDITRRVRIALWISTIPSPSVLALTQEVTNEDL